jgi:geranylgeranyl pyrophosphate synthase
VLNDTGRLSPASIEKETGMDIYDRTFNLLANIPVFDSWPELKLILERSVANRPHDWMLPVVGCQVVEGNTDHTICAVAAIACMQISIILIDDILDQDPRGSYHQFGIPQTANMSLEFQSIGLDVITRAKINFSTKLAVIDSFNKMMLTVALGQYLDIQNPANEPAFWQLVRTKSSPFFCTALFVGFLLGGGPDRLADPIREFGNLYGEMIQIHDDINDSMASPANPDWMLGRLPLPILFASTVNHPHREEFLAKRKEIPDPVALTEVQEMLIQCGAISYCIHHLLARYQAAQELIEKTAFPNKVGLYAMLDKVLKPVMNIYSSLGVPVPEYPV